MALLYLLYLDGDRSDAVLEGGDSRGGRFDVRGARVYFPELSTDRWESCIDFLLEAVDRCQHCEHIGAGRSGLGLDEGDGCCSGGKARSKAVAAAIFSPGHGAS